MIASFATQATRLVFEGEFAKSLPNQIQAIARRKLRMVANAERIDDLRIPPNNRLELLKGTRSGQHSIRINDQWRVCFVWRAGQAHEVEICDTH